MDTIKKTFKMSLGGHTIIDLVVEGDQDYVDAFTKQCITDSWGMFHKTKDELMKFVLNGFAVSADTILRDQKTGKYISKEKVLKGTNLKVETTINPKT